MDALRGLRELFQPRGASIVKSVRKAEERLRGASDESLRSTVEELRGAAAKGERLKRLLPEAFACAVLAAERTVGMRPFDVQLLGAAELARGRVVEMKTGEGKTLVATMPVVLHALRGRGVHVVTVNDYLAKRDAEWMRPIYELLGLSVGCIQESMAPSREAEIVLRREAYGCDVTYVTNSECVFDFLRDNLAGELEQVVHRELHFAIVDEVDLLLVDEAQTPLIISGPTRHDPGRIEKADQIVGALAPRRHYIVDGRSRTAALNDRGLRRVESALDVGPLTDPSNLPWAHAVYQALQAHGVQERDVDYVVRGDRVLIVDPHTGRVSEEKRYSSGLHQALEAKEGVPVRSDNATLARTSYQHFFRSYELLGGMTGTAWSAREELGQTYGLEVARILTNRPMIRVDQEPVLYRTREEKHDAVVDEILEARQEGQPVLVGTLSVGESETLSEMLEAEGVPHEVLNAKRHDREAEVIAQAGRRGAVTISTNMAGRGTDIMLGGNPRLLAEAEEAPEDEAFPAVLAERQAACDKEREEVLAAGGLLVIGTGEHASRRIDDQLRGRSGRQGDPGQSMYALSLDDPVYERAGRPGAVERLRAHTEGHPEDEPIEDGDVLSTLRSLRDAVEVQNQAARRDVFKIDTVVHERREAIWSWRRDLLETTDPLEWKAAAADLLEDLAERLDERALAAAQGPDRVKPGEAWATLLAPIVGWGQGEVRGDPIVVDGFGAASLLVDSHGARFGTIADEPLARWERTVLLAVIDSLWPDYLDALERTEDEVWMRSYAQVDPFVEFRKEAAMMFGELMIEILSTAARAWLGAEIRISEVEET